MTTAPDDPPARAHRRWPRRLLVVALVLGALGAGVYAFLDGGYRYFFPRRWGVVEEGRIYRSGLIHRRLIEDVLEKHDIATVVDLTGLDESDPDVAAERAAAARLLVRVVVVPGLAGDATGPSASYAVALAEMARAEPGRAVLVHCVGGSERTGVAVALFRMLLQGWDGARAWEEYLRYRRYAPEDDVLSRSVNERMEDVARRLVADGLLPRVPEPLPVFGPRRGRVTSAVPRIASRWFRSRAWIGIALLAPASVLALLSPQPFPQDSWQDAALDAASYLALVAGVALRLWATLYLGGRRGREVVSEGPYSVVRNPLYLGSFLIALSVAGFLESLTVLVAVLVAAIVYAGAPVRAEERVLLDSLGEAYAAYRARTPRFLPRPSLFRASPRLDVSVLAMRKEARRTLRFLWIPVLHVVLERLREAPWWPQPLRFP